MEITPKGRYAAMMSAVLAGDGHVMGLTDDRELLEEDGRQVPEGGYHICLKCGEIWRI